MKARQIVVLLMLIMLLSSIVAYAATDNYVGPNGSKKDSRPIEDRFKDKFIGTVRATGMMWLPTITAISIVLLILGQTFESAQNLVQVAYRFIISAVVGFILMFGCEFIADIFMDITGKLDLRL